MPGEVHSLKSIGIQELGLLARHESQFRKNAWYIKSLVSPVSEPWTMTWLGLKLVDFKNKLKRKSNE